MVEAVEVKVDAAAQLAGELKNERCRAFWCYGLAAFTISAMISFIVAAGVVSSDRLGHDHSGETTRVVRAGRGRCVGQQGREVHAGACAGACVKP